MCDHTGSLSVLPQVRLYPKHFNTECEHPCHPSLTPRNEQPWPFTPGSPGIVALNSKKILRRPEELQVQAQIHSHLQHFQQRTSPLSRKGYKSKRGAVSPPRDFSLECAHSLCPRFTAPLLTCCPQIQPTSSTCPHQNTKKQSDAVTHAHPEGTRCIRSAQAAVPSFVLTVPGCLEVSFSSHFTLLLLLSALG